MNDLHNTQFIYLVKNYMKKSKKAFAFLFVAIAAIVPLLPLPELFDDQDVYISNIRIISVGIVCMLILYIIFEIHETVTRTTEDNNNFDCFDQIRELFCSTTNSCFEGNHPVEIKMLGVALAFSWPALRATLVEYYKKNKRLPGNVEIDISILSYHWLNEHLGNENRLWKQRSEVLLTELDNFIEGHKEHIVFNERALVGETTKNKLKIKFQVYPYTPNYHGILISEKRAIAMPRETLFLSHCAWDSTGGLSAGENSYTFSQTGMTDKELLEKNIYQFKSWFKYKNSAVDLEEFRKLALGASGN